MLNATNIDATATNTITWLATGHWSIVVPVYQRQYRWDIGSCERLLVDVRAAADSPASHMHFIGSILSSLSGDAGSGAGAELVLIDGQQRLTTLMLLISALHHTVRPTDPELADELLQVLVSPADGRRTKLRPHSAWAEVFEDVVLDRTPAQGAHRESRFDDNYAFFRSQISVEEAPRIWRGLQKLEHVAITLGVGANAQQIFESLNSTGEPLRDHELIHNYILMGLSHTEQRQIEEQYWIPIERNTGDSIAAFWRQYLVMVTGREVSVAGGRGVYDTFRQVFPRIEAAQLRAYAHEWRSYSEVYRTLMNPEEAPDSELSRQLHFAKTFGSSMYPLIMRDYADLLDGALARESFISRIENVQSLALRRAVVGLSNDRLVARLCRARDSGAQALERAFERVTPSDARVRVALKYSPLPYPAYVLGRLADLHTTNGLGIEHIVPAAPADSWSGDGVRTWAELSDDEQNSHRALADTIGNLTLLEDELALSALDKSYAAKRRLYARSTVTLTAALDAVPAWNTTAIAARSTALVERFIEVWRRPGELAIDDDGLTPILDAVRRRGWPAGWEREFAYVEYRGEHWEVPDIKYLFNRVFKRLWADSRDAVISYNARRGGPVYEARSWNGQWDQLDDSHHLYMGWDSSYMLTAVQGVLDEAGIAAEVFLKYSYIGDAMR
ncbi:DUF262 domain-containing protein [Microbacterium sp. R86528]|uniref:DUF262 domain-containing protein n=1 Tax=Microbacterium sp. R86528 TaxID=3093864 RepID=UPI0037CCA5EA